MATKKNMNPIQREIEETLNVAGRIERVSASDDLIQRLKTIPTAAKEAYEIVPKKIIWSVAASIVILVILNVLSVQNYTEGQKTPNSEQSSDYFNYLKTI